MEEGSERVVIASTNLSASDKLLETHTSTVFSLSHQTLIPTTAHTCDVTNAQATSLPQIRASLLLRADTSSGEVLMCVLLFCF